MAAVRGCTITLLLCTLLLATAVTGADESDSAAPRARGHGKTPNGKRRQVKGQYTECCHWASLVYIA
jgi:hypothetical protein